MTSIDQRTPTPEEEKALWALRRLTGAAPVARVLQQLQQERPGLLHDVCAELGWALIALRPEAGSITTMHGGSHVP